MKKKPAEFGKTDAEDPKEEIVEGTRGLIVEVAANVIEVDGKMVELDKDGYLAIWGEECSFIDKMNEWNENVAIEMAEEDGLELVEEHRYAIKFVRDYYEKYGVAPMTRIVGKHHKERYDREKINIDYFRKLFNCGDPIKRIIRYAGLPRPVGIV